MEDNPFLQEEEPKEKEPPSQAKKNLKGIELLKEELKKIKPFRG